MNFKIMGIVLGAAGFAASIVKAVNDHKKWLNTPLVCSPMMEDISNKINEEYKREHNGESPSDEEFSNYLTKNVRRCQPRKVFSALAREVTVKNECNISFASIIPERALFNKGSFFSPNRQPLLFFAVAKKT